MSEWWTELYTETFAEAYMDRTSPEDIEVVATFLQGFMRSGSSAFDQCCGTGEIAVELARRGHTVIGVDQAVHYVERARARADDVAARTCEFHAGDAFEFVADAPCNLAYNWWSGFGYAQEDQANLRMVEAAYLSLSPGGVYVIDTMNSAQVLRSFEPLRVTEHALDAGSASVEARSRIDLATGTMHKGWTVTRPDGEREECSSRVRLYAPHELGALMRSAGFVNVTWFGGTDRSRLALDSPRCIVVGERP